MRTSWRDNEKEKKRFYLLPGQGGRAYRRKQMTILKASLLVGLLVGGILAIVIYVFNSPSR